MILIVDKCQNPYSLNPTSILNDYEYVITDYAIEYQITPFEVDPDRCQLTYTFSVTDSAGEAAVSFDADTLTFTFFNDEDVELGGVEEELYEVTVQATSGQVSEISSFDLVLKNPCFDPAYVLIETSFPPDQEYRMDATAIEWTHGGATVTT